MHLSSDKDNACRSLSGVNNLKLAHNNNRLLTLKLIIIIII